LMALTRLNLMGWAIACDDYIPCRLIDTVWK
jgi:hypothetical protein